MKQWQLGAQPGWENLEWVDGADPSPGPGEVVVRLGAASLNYRDLLVATLAERHRPGRVPLSDGAGEIVAVGSGVTRWRVGDRVAGLFFRDWQSGRFEHRYHDAALGGSVDGVLRETAVFPDHAVAAIPHGWSLEEAATLPCAALTAWSALFERGRLERGQSVLLLGTGGVSVWALQFARAAGAEILITSSSDAKLERARGLGATQGINHQTFTAWDDEVRRLTGGRGVDHVLEVGGPGTLGRSLNSLASGGHLALIGVLTGFGPPDCSLFPLVSKNATASGIYVGHAESFAAMTRFIDTHRLRPVIDRTFPLSEAREAFAHLSAAGHFGKVVVSFSTGDS
jgi:NADPH:quinone reductase-like Zn-dependent oxidoreductase